MADIPGVSLNLTGASGTQGALSPMSNWRFYVLPRGGFASQISSGTTITFDTAAVAARFAVGQWIQAGLQTANLRQVSGVGGNSITVSGAALSVAVNDRIFIIGATQPTVTGGSATYTTPDTRIYQRDDDTSTLYTNSMVTSNSDGLIQFFAPANTLDAIIQDSNQGNQGFVADLTIGAAGISTSSVTTFGATVTINAALGVTGSAAFGGTVTMHGALGVTGFATIGQTLTVNGAFGVTGTAVFGATATFNAAIGVTGTATFGASARFNAPVGFTGGVEIRAGLSVTSGILGVSAQPRVMLYNPIGAAGFSITTGLSTTIAWASELYNVGSMHGGTSSRITIQAGAGGLYHFIAAANLTPAAGAGGETRSLFIQKNTALTVGYMQSNLQTSGALQDLYVGTQDVAVPGDFYEMVIFQTHGSSLTVNGVTSGMSRFGAVKVC